MKERWMVTAKGGDFAKIGEQFQISPVIARLIRNRDVVGEEEIREYLYGRIEDLPSPWLLKGLKEGIGILAEKVKSGKAIRIIGDYDIDGVCSTYILHQGLLRAGAKVDIEIPNRMKDGYGINEELIRLAYEDGIDTIITCDNGISAGPQITYGKELGMTIIVTDHHEVPYEEQEDGSKKPVLPGADVVINPKQPDCPYPFKELCGAGVAWKVIYGLFETFCIPFEELGPLVELAAIATVGDVMELKGENRVLVKEGLKRIQNTKNLGLQELIRVNQLTEKTITAYHIGFILGPCLNASGRLSSAKRALAMLESGDREEAARLAGDLKALNDSRKDMTAEATADAVEMVENTDLWENKVLVIFLPECHESLAGIVAGRIREMYCKPVFVLTRGEEGIKGSGRSIEAYHMFEALSECRACLNKFGGHPMAAGLSLSEENISVLKKQLNENCRLTEEDFVKKVLIDAALPFSYLDMGLAEQVHLLEPFGKGNTKPLFAQKEVRLMEPRIFGKNRNVVKMQAADAQGGAVSALYFGDGDAFVKKIRDKETWSITYYPEVNRYMGKEELQIVVQNLQ